MSEPRRPMEGWPELPRALPPKLDLPLNPSPMQLAQVYATSYLSFGSYWEKSTQALEFLYGSTMGAKSQAEEALRGFLNLATRLEKVEVSVQHMDGALDAVSAKLDRLLGVLPEGIPPMRAEMDSSHQLVERTTNSISDQLKELAKKTPGPPSMLTATPDQIVLLVQRTISDEAEKAKAVREIQRLQEIEANNKKQESDKKARDESERQTRADTVRQIRVGITVAVVSGMILAAGGFLWGSFQGRTAGHAEGVIEGRQIESNGKAR